MSGPSDFLRLMDWRGLLDMVLRVCAVLLCVMVHEVCHGLAAYLLGDPTAKDKHRLSFNPLRHIDPFGALMMLTVGFGWARPVPVDMRYFKHPKSGMAITALAGPISNFVLAYTALAVYSLAVGISALIGAAPPTLLRSFCLQVAMLSIGLGIFNLVPVPPLDGSKVLGAFLPDRAYVFLMRYERYGMLGLMALLWSGLLDQPLYAARLAVFNTLAQAASWISLLPGLF